MSEEAKDELGEMLADGWDIVGYTVNMLAAGAQHHNILLRKGNSLTSFTILNNGGTELARGPVPLCPPPASKKKGGWFS